ncbi:MAG: bifunctional hydroxymethylpyrimidine kinase/phosphomethylpyrimidine kinase [Castellaniella sp.]|uniref:bifunctional hydroxymethylpyrimidine kinase/phosphomethylpyrimidine kinase n=1 Tax=Castellaniella sp. TaxID=1955812 RepID=UPI002A361583|nr:bifunctional hydroxymethylpyrimidine kinase/phosphomethylpyrimidine kinase [Castellaniella sp.]MDY0308563.1 bifunctional hydroxymethylpyrimidine kinase/phosphomethylpyrimidine kinase [Castellaniella sp.]
MGAIVYEPPAVATDFLSAIMPTPDFPAIPLPLIFGPFDPSGASHLPIDAAICAGLGAHAGCVVTAIHVQDSAGTETIQRLAPDLVDDQARCLLEDMAIGALKIGPQYDPETIATLAQIAADYCTLPLVLQLCAPPPVPDLDDLDPEETVGALLELLLPQAHLVVVDAHLPEQWASQGLLSSTRADDPIAALHELGAPLVLCSNAALGPGLNGLVLHARDQASRRWPWPAPRVRTGDADSLLATVLCCLLARGLDPDAAISQAVTTTTTLLERHFHPGMGQRILLHAAP